ncbi:MFS transporter [Vibrio profundum]|uniref:MFS transporter n=1 Tax=Vibrio profundum TaxID=2910247 RepID=UPI003D09BFBF
MNEKNTSPLFIYIIVLSQFVVPFMFSGVGVTLPSIGHDFSASGVSLGLIETIYLGASAAFLLPMGKLGDSGDKKTIFKYGQLIFALTTLALGFMPTIEAVIAVRFVQGVASAMLAATGMAIITDVVPAQFRGKAFGFSIGAIYAGIATGPLISGVITHYLSWHWVYWISFIPLSIACALSFSALPSQWKKIEQPFDFVGSSIVIISLMSLIFGGAWLSKSQWGYALLLSGLVFAVIFVFSQLRSRYPLVDVRELIYNVKLSESLVIQMLLYASAFGTTFLFSLYLQVIRGYDPEIAGRILVIGSILMACVAPIAGRLSDRCSPRILTTIGSLSVFTSTLLSIYISAETSLTYLITILLLQGLGFALFSSPNMSVIMGSVDKSRTSVASALAAKTRSLGMVVSMLVTTIFLALIIGDGELSQHKPGFLTAMSHSFIVFSSLAGFSAAIGVYLLSKKS